MLHKKNLIVLDIDGTLTDTVDIHQSAFKKSLNLIGVKEFNDKFGSYRHHTDSFIAKVIYETNTSKKFDKKTSQVFENHLYEIISETTINEITGAKNFVNHIENQTDFGICYATGSMYLPAKHKLEKIGLNFTLDLLVASNEIEEREKIVEAAIEKSLKHYKVDRFERIITFGDGIWDLLTAKNLSLEFVGIGKRNQEILINNGMKKHFYDFSQLVINEL